MSAAHKLLAMVSCSQPAKFADAVIIHQWWNCAWVVEKKQISDVTDILTFAMNALSREQSQKALKRASKELEEVDEADQESVETWKLLLKNSTKL